MKTKTRKKQNNSKKSKTHKFWYIGEITFKIEMGSSTISSNQILQRIGTFKWNFNEIENKTTLKKGNEHRFCSYNSCYKDNTK